MRRLRRITKPLMPVPGTHGGAPRHPLALHEACGIQWDDADVVRFLGKCSWESRVEDGKVKRCLIWRGAKSRGGAHRAAGRKAGNKKWYGSFSVKGKTVRAHKFSAVAIHGLGPGPDDEIDHNCYDTLCVFCLECVPREVNQARIRRGSKNAEGRSTEGQPQQPARVEQDAPRLGAGAPDFRKSGEHSGYQPGGGPPCC